MSRIIFMGTPDFAVPALKALLASGEEVAAVVTQPDKPKGRKGEPAPSPVKEAALEAGCRILQPVRCREEGFYEELAALSPDLIVVAAFGQIIPKSILTLPPRGCVNLHASLLPAYRGASPIQHAILDGLAETGVTLMQMGEGLDTGDILRAVKVPILEEDTGGSLFDKLAEAGAKLLLDSLPELLAGTIPAVPQPEESTTPYARMITKEMGRLDFSRDADALHNLVRAMDPWPSAYTRVKGKMLKVWKSRALPQQGETPGQILEITPEGILVSCGKGSLLLLEVQLEGKKRMKSADFLRGFALEAGEVLG